MTFVIAFLAGLATVLSPCVLPLLPLVVGGTLSHRRLGPLALCSGLSLSFSLLGVATVMATQSFGFDPAIVRISGATLLLLFGIALLLPTANYSFSKWLGPLASKANHLAANAGSGLGGAFVTGLLLGAIWSPCAGPTLGTAIALATQANTAAKGLAMMLVFGVAASLPLLALAYGAQGIFNRHRERLNAIANRSKPVFGAMVALVSIAILAGWDKQLESMALQSMPESWVQLVTGL